MNIVCHIIKEHPLPSQQTEDESLFQISIERQCGFRYTSLWENTSIDPDATNHFFAVHSETQKPTAAIHYVIVLCERR